MALSVDFTNASSEVTHLKNRPDNDTLLALYALYKQASEGDVSGKKPGMLDIKARKKFEAWAKLKGLESEQAQQKYIQLVSELKSKEA